jgi:hypothetical protein
MKRPADDVARIWLEAERPFQLNDYDGGGRRILRVENEPASLVCLVAVHGVNHYSGPRDTDRKVADLNTGGLVRLLGGLTGATVAYNCSRHPGINPHRGETAMDREIDRLVEEAKVRTVLDIHGARNNEHFDIAIGTGGLPLTSAQRSLLRFMVPRLTDASWSVAINPPQYAGAKPVTIVRRHRDKAGVAVLQLELTRRLREPRERESWRMVETMRAILTDLQKR